MHECPECGMVCDCIGDDTWNSLESAYCTHQCCDWYLGEDDDNEFFDGQEYGYEE